MQEENCSKSKWPLGLKIIALWVILAIPIGSCQLLQWIDAGEVFGNRYNVQTTYVILVCVLTAIAFFTLCLKSRKNFVFVSLLLACTHTFTILHYSFGSFYSKLQMGRSEIKYYFDSSTLGSMLYLFFLSYVFFYIYKYELFREDKALKVDSLNDDLIE